MSDKSANTPQTTSTIEIDEFSIAADTFGVLDADADAEDANEQPRSALARLTAWTAATHASGSSASHFWQSLLTGYSGQFIREIVVAVVIGLVCNGIWGIPLYQVVDVNLAISLSLIVVFAGALGIVFFLELANGMLRGAVETLVYIASLCFLPFGAVVGYMIYSGLGGGDVTSTSFVFKAYVGMFADTYSWAAARTGDVLGAIQQQRNTAGELVPVVDMQLIRVTMETLAAAAVIINFLRDWLRPVAVASRYR